MEPITDVEGTTDELGIKSKEDTIGESRRKSKKVTIGESRRKSEEGTIGELRRKKVYCKQRRIVAFMGFLSMAVAYFARIILGVSLTDMVRISPKKPLIYFPLFKYNNETNTYHSKYSPEYDVENDKFNWDEIQQGNILSAFYFGSVLSHIPGGIYSEKYGGKIVVCSSLVVGAISSLMSPSFATHGGYFGLCSCRVIQGVSQGVLCPGLSYFLARWIPKKERGRYGSLVYGGGQFGALAGNVISGYMISHINWDSPFYMAGALQIVWAVAFFLFCTNDPLSNPHISKEEKDYLIAELGDHVKKDIPPTPWKNILRSKHCIAFFICQICYDWGLFVIAINLPKYFADVIHVPVEINGVINAIAFFFMWIFSILSGFMADYIYRHNILTLTNNRNFFTTISFLIPALLMLGAGYATEIDLMLFCFITAIGIMGFYYAGLQLTPLDISPNFAPTIMAIGCGLGAISGIAVPNVIAIMTPNASRLQWQNVFLLTFLIRFVGTFVYLIFITAEKQSWDSPVVVEERNIEEIYRSIEEI